MNCDTFERIFPYLAFSRMNAYAKVETQLVSRVVNRFGTLNRASGAVEISVKTVPSRFYFLAAVYSKFLANSFMMSMPVIWTRIPKRMATMTCLSSAKHMDM